MRRILRVLRHAFVRAMQHDAFGVAKGAAYSSILTMFPALMAVGSILATSELSEVFLREISYALGMLLPVGVGSTVISLLDEAKDKPVRFILTASLITLWTASGVMVSWMEGFRRAYQIPPMWGFVKERLIAFSMVFLAGVPLTFATFMVAFGNQIETWIEYHAGYEFAPAVVLGWTILRWVIAALTSVAVIALIYHFAIPRTQPVQNVLPGAVMATILWFPATMLFGFYVQRYATYSHFYGALGTAIALLVWLYIICLIVLIGAECNAYLFPRVPAAATPINTPITKNHKRVKVRG